MVSRHTSTHPTDGEVSYYRCRSLYLTEAGSAASREVALYDQAFVDTFIHPLANRGRVIAGRLRRHQRADRAEYPATLTGGQPGTQSIVDPAVAQ